MNPLTCANKKAYLCPEAAAKAAKGRMLDGVAYLRVYACPECGAFHLTHKKHYFEQKGNK